MASTVTAGRTRRVLLNIGVGSAAKAGGVLLSFVAMPIMLQLMGPAALGSWLVLLSVFQWVTFFDLGMAAGARNEIARAHAARDEEGVRSAISTGWLCAAGSSLIVFAILALLLSATPAVSLMVNNVLSGDDVKLALWIVAAASCVALLLGFIQSVYAALEKAAAFSLFSFATNLLFVLLLLVARHLEWTSVSAVSLLYTAALFAANLVLIASFFSTYRQYKPSIAGVHWPAAKKIAGFGLNLFAIQVAAMLIFTTHRLLASWMLGPQSVVVYDAAFKIFAIILILHGLVMSTLWSSFTQAHESNDWDWIEKTIRTLLLMMIPLALACGILAALSPWLVRHWLGEDQVGSASLYGWFAVVTLLSCWSNVFANFVNGIGKTRVQLYSAVGAAVINIPASIYFARYCGYGLTGILMGTSVSLLFFSVAGPLQVASIVKARGKR
jgi:O-antigen/teichoic acid export membrane protein